MSLGSVQGVRLPALRKGSVLSVARVRIDVPPGVRCCDGKGGEWLYARGTSGAAPWMDDVERLKRAFPSDEARTGAIQTIAELMGMATTGTVPGDLVTLMRCAPDVMEIKLPDWWFSGGKMQTRLYFSEPWDLPGHLVALRLRFKRPVPLGVEDQTGHALEASDLLSEFAGRNFC